ncbi:methanogenesis marker protein 16 [Methanobrevibacter sp. YE315]|uniref:nitroreductase family protein n=1 Tax=Methanobrevibacter sp. YE315 TaxID=1609968 RepID=UPI000764D02E|nr:nitroreductase family protein [Methanobrevibacter sp. YE315]AMD18314.1 methanogenesis marker protein 16 [Methanobrevibacter sp. YE315]
MKLIIDEELCVACKQCMQVCIRDNIIVEDFAVETGGNCFECGHCMAICKQKAITLKSFEGKQDRIQDYNPREIPVEYEELLQFLKQRRSVRWFKNKKIDKETFDKLFEGAYYSPSAQNQQDVEFVVLDEKLDDFMNLVYEIIKVKEDEFFRIKEFGDYLKDNTTKEFHPLLWEGKQLILTFSTDKTSAVIANARLELLAYSLGLGGFYSLFILKADEINHDKLMEFFPKINKNKHMYSAFIIGYPKLRFRRTIPHKDINVTYF